MHAEVIFIDDADQRQGVEGIHDVEVHILVVLLNCLEVKIHDLSHLPRFVITTQHEDLIREFDLKSHKDKNNLHSLRASIYIIPEKEKTFFGSGIHGRKKTHNLK